MNEFSETCPMMARAQLEAYFLEHRARLLDLAAFFDRLDRARGGPPAEDEPRLAALRAALAELAEGSAAGGVPDRTARLQRIFSDPTSEPLVGSDGRAAWGAWRGGPADPKGEAAGRA